MPEPKPVDPILKGSEVIPAMTHPLAKHWKQCNLDEVTMDSKEVSMTAFQLAELMDYSTTNPTGTYVGKCWKARIFDHARQTIGWKLCWYGQAAKNDTRTIVHSRTVTLK
jgi:hypothetical protein